MYYECDGKCIHGSEPCNGECQHKKMSAKCGKTCLSPDDIAQFSCQDECQYTNLPCDGTCHKSNPKKCGRKCIPNNGTCYVWDSKLNGLKRVNDPTKLT
jgi:hypothetical protein